MGCCDLQWLKAGHTTLTLVLQLTSNPTPHLTGPQILIGNSVDNPLKASVEIIFALRSNPSLSLLLSSYDWFIFEA